MIKISFVITVFFEFVPVDYEHPVYIYIYLFSMINNQQASSMIDSQFYMEQLLKPENSLRTTGFEPVSSVCEQKV